MLELDWRNLAIPSDADFRSAMRIIDHGGAQFGLVVDTDGVLCGVVTDGIIRRAILAGVALEEPVCSIMHKKPIVIRHGKEKIHPRQLMRDFGIGSLPAVDDAGRVVGFYSLLNSEYMKSHDNLVVIMAGGLGSRMGSITRSIPKPMLKVNNKPILELIIEQMAKHGFKRFCLVVNHLSECITKHFGDGSEFGVNVEYLHESKRMGTVGGLSLLKVRPEKPILVMNGDVLSHIPWSKMLRVHEESNAPATMAVSMHKVAIPYGVVKYDSEQRITDIEEKPQYSFPVSAGANIISPMALDSIPPDSFFDMPDLFRVLIENDQKPKVFELSGYWMDIGRPEDYHKVANDFTL